MTLKKASLGMIFCLLGLSMTRTAQALSLDWKGVYRSEWTEVSRPTLATPYGAKSYGLNYLSLSPHIIASDGVNIVSKFDILGNQNSAYQSAQFGQIWGQGWPENGASYQNNVYAQNQQTSYLGVSQMYLNINQEYGSLVVGRAPIEFGLGIMYNAGNGVFDHWATTEDLVAYKVIIDNFFIMPMFGRVYSPTPAQGNTVQDLMIQAQYESKESGSMIGLMHRTRKASPGVNDVPVASNYIPQAATLNGDFATQTESFVLGREWDSFAFKFEGDFISGDTGALTAAGQNVKASSYGVAAELLFPRKATKTEWNIRLGMASGNDPTTASYQGFQFNRNYDVALLLFNHRLGQKDFMSSALIRDPSKNASNSLDDEAIGNAMYVSPKFTYAWTDHLDLSNIFTYARMMANSTGASNLDKNLGFEWDVELDYKASERIRWLNELGIFFPGKAFRNGDDGLETATTFGFNSELAISF